LAGADHVLRHDRHGQVGVDHEERQAGDRDGERHRHAEGEQDEEHDGCCEHQIASLWTRTISESCRCLIIFSTIVTIISAQPTGALMVAQAYLIPRVWKSRAALLI